jgi:hypothetical protein
MAIPHDGGMISLISKVILLDGHREWLNLVALLWIEFRVFP